VGDVENSGVSWGMRDDGESGEGDGEGEAGKEDDVELPEYLKNSKGKGMIKTVLCFSIVKTQYPETSLF
jgi:hypothetical protein